MMCVNVFLYTKEQHFSWIRQMRNFPIDPSIKIAHFCIDMTIQKLAIFIMEVYGENLCLLSEQAETSFLTILQTLTHIMKVSARNNK